MQKPHRQGWQFVGSIHAKAHSHIKNDIVKTHGLAIVKVLRFLRGDKVWDKEQQKYFISIIDIVRVLTESDNPRKYWSVLKTRLKKEGSELATICNQLKL